MTNGTCPLDYLSQIHFTWMRIVLSICLFVCLFTYECARHRDNPEASEPAG